MRTFDRITLDPDVMGGKPCIRGLRLTVGTILGLLAAGRSEEEILKAYPYLEKEDIQAALTYATWRVEERELTVTGPRKRFKIRGSHSDPRRSDRPLQALHGPGACRFSLPLGFGSD